MFFPTWDLVVAILFLIITTYSYALGKKTIVKIIFCTYIAIIMSDALANLFQRSFLSDPHLPIMLPTDNTPIILLKIVLLLLFIPLLINRFDIQIKESGFLLVRTVVKLSYSILSAGLLISTLFLYISGQSLIGYSPFLSSDALYEIASSSRLVQVVVNNFAIWFSLPAICFLIGTPKITPGTVDQSMALENKSHRESDKHMPANGTLQRKVGPLRKHHKRSGS